MEPLYYVMAIMGCADGGTMCAEARTAAPRYTSYQACQAAMETELMRASDLDFPEIVAACRSTRPMLVEREGRNRG